jgi:hypothetical protein
MSSTAETYQQPYYYFDNNPLLEDLLIQRKSKCWMLSSDKEEKNLFFNIGSSRPMMTRTKPQV